MAERLDEFELPRPDWYDSKGRIYKDRLIENFNAIEERLILISKLDSPLSEIPDVSGVIYPDVALDSSDDSIVNLKSLIDIMQLKGYPIELRFEGDNKVKYLGYYDNNYTYKTITDKKLENVSNTNKYIVFNYENGTVFANSSISGGKLIAVYDNGKLLGINTDTYADINVLYYLAQMKNTQHPYNFSSGTRDDTSVSKGLVINNRVVGAGDTNTKTGGTNNVIFRDTGRLI